MSAMPEGQDPGGRRRRLSGGAIASIGGGAFLVIFIAQNTEKIRLHFLAWTFSWPLWLYTILTALFGAFIWIGLGVLRRHRRRRERRQERRERL
ncbi:MAG: LapA family protein [Acidimicrobiales bacterium]|nr:LapA family protein [Acidimicrobiales bacterium]